MKNETAKLAELFGSSQAKPFLTNISNGADISTEVFCISYSKAGARRLGYSKVLDIDDLDTWEYLKRENQKQDIFFLVNVSLRRRRNQDIESVRAFFIDWDKSDISPPEFPISPHIVVQSSPGKFHFYWKTKCSIKDWQWIQKALVAKYPECDQGVKDLARVLRLPGFVSHKHGGRVELIKNEWAVPINSKDFTKAFELKNPRTRAKNVMQQDWISPSDIEYGKMVIKWYLERMTTKGRENWFKILCAIHNEIKEEGYELARWFSEEIATPDTTDLIKEFDKTWTSIALQNRNEGYNMGTIINIYKLIK